MYYCSEPTSFDNRAVHLTVMDCCQLSIKYDNVLESVAFFDSHAKAISACKRANEFFLYGSFIPYKEN